MEQPLQVDWKVLLYGQLIALSLACCSAASSTLQKIVCIPLFQIAGGYFFLSFNILKLKKHKEGINDSPPSTPRDDDLYMNEESEATLLLHCDNGLIKQSIYLPNADADCQETYVSVEAQHENIIGKDLPRYNLPIFKNIQLHSPWYFYLILAFLDVQANYFVVLSFQYTSLINTNLLTSLSIISVMTTSKIILKKVFRAYHFVGSFLVLLGASFIVSSDFHLRGEPPSEQKALGVVNIHHLHLRGDLFAITAALLFGFNDALAEYCIEVSTVEEYLAMLGIFGYFFSISESILFEREQVQEFLHLILGGVRVPPENSSAGGGTLGDDELHEHGHDIIHLGETFIIWVVYIVSLIFFYTAASKFLRVADATLLNLSLQSSNMWTICFSIVVQSIFPTPLFYCAVVIMFAGVWIYEKGF